MRGEDDTLKKLSSSPAELRPQTHREIQLLRFVLGAEEAEEDGEEEEEDGSSRLIKLLEAAELLETRL